MRQGKERNVLLQLKLQVEGTTRAHTARGEQASFHSADESWVSLTLFREKARHARGHEYTLKLQICPGHNHIRDIGELLQGPNVLPQARSTHCPWY